MNYAIVVVDGKDVAVNNRNIGDICIQEQIFRHFGMSLGLMSTYEYNARKDESMPNGIAWVITKRERPINIEWSDMGHALSYSRMEGTYGEDYLDASDKRGRVGKYNDEARVFFNESQTVEVGEVGAFASF